MLIKTTGKLVVSIIAVIIVSGLLFLFYKPRLVKTPNDQNEMQTALKIGLDCEKSACTWIESGESISLFGGLVKCYAPDGLAGYYQAETCLFQDMFSKICRANSCVPDRPSGYDTGGCRTNRDCPDGACVNARIIDNKVVIDGGFCTKDTSKMLGGTNIKYTCVCLSE